MAYNIIMLEQSEPVFRSELSSLPFHIDVFSEGETPVDWSPWPISFFNSIDFPKPRGPIKTQTSNIVFQINESSPYALAGPIRVEPISHIPKVTHIDQEDALFVLGNYLLGPFVYLGTAASMVKTAESMPTMSRRAFLGLAALSSFVGLETIVEPGLLKLSGKGGDVLATLYSRRAQVSAMRSVIIMHDVWREYREKFLEYPVLAVSASTNDGLEGFAAQNPELLRQRLLLSPDLRELLVLSIKEAGSVEAFFSRKVTDIMTGQEGIVPLQDAEFIAHVKSTLGNALLDLSPKTLLEQA